MITGSNSHYSLIWGEREREGVGGGGGGGGRGITFIGAISRKKKSRIARTSTYTVKTLKVTSPQECVRMGD